MEIDVVLCNHAEVAENKLFLTGGGITMAMVAPTPPHVVTVTLGLVIHIPYQMTNQSHALNVSLVDEDGHGVVPYQEEGAATAPTPVELSVPFNVGRPPLITVGDEQTIALAANIVNLPLSATGLYTFIVEIDGTEMRRLPLRVLTPPPGFMPMLPGAQAPAG